MNFTNPEKAALIVLSILLLAGAAILHIKHSRIHHKVTITKNAVKNEFTLKEIEERLREKRRVSINTATAEQLTTIPGIGGVFAARIIGHRDQKGPFRTERGLLDVKGIGEKKLDKMKPFIKIE